MDILKRLGARLRESDMLPVSQKTPAPQYQPIDRKIMEKYKTIVGIEQLTIIKSIYPALETCQSHTIEYGVSKIVPLGH